ncbi:Two-component response regulator-like PRR37 [Porphyridium purpureum]|uniref:Two-component response regulator-like PRR37 n=1 Tax=Porphyridium purpureum TaxID=35688 RepID=A0A5J4YYF2_PORPP|nr:Two-component response regulator-like PRR37 [Porphyridium purpureum]|eukprot:POR8278..scf209_3
MARSAEISNMDFGGFTPELSAGFGWTMTPGVDMGRSIPVDELHGASGHKSAAVGAAAITTTPVVNGNVQFRNAVSCFRQATLDSFRSLQVVFGTPTLPQQPTPQQSTPQVYAPPSGCGLNINASPEISALGPFTPQLVDTTVTQNYAGPNDATPFLFSPQYDPHVRMDIMSTRLTPQFVHSQRDGLPLVPESGRRMSPDVLADFTGTLPQALQSRHLFSPGERSTYTGNAIANMRSSGLQLLDLAQLHPQQPPQPVAGQKQERSGDLWNTPSHATGAMQNQAVNSSYVAAAGEAGKRWAKVAVSAAPALTTASQVTSSAVSAQAKHACVDGLGGSKALFEQSDGIPFANARSSQHYHGSKSQREIDYDRLLKKKAREAAILRLRQKRKERSFNTKVRYTCRKQLADSRPRVKGRFIKHTVEQQVAVQEAMRQHAASARLDSPVSLTSEPVKQSRSNV